MSVVRVNPANGDNVATLTVNGEPVMNVNKGELLKVVGRTTGGYSVQIDSKLPNEARGGCSSFGVIAANPYTHMYKDENKHAVYGRINNGTEVDILDVCENMMLKVRGITTNGEKEGYVEARFVYRAASTED